MDTPVDLSNTEIQNFLVRRLGEKEAAEIMTYINQEVAKEVAAKVGYAKSEITSWREEMKTLLATREDSDRLKGRLLKRVSKAENVMIFWNFIFWFTALLIILCFIKFV